MVTLLFVVLLVLLLLVELILKIVGATEGNIVGLVDDVVFFVVLAVPPIRSSSISLSLSLALSFSSNVYNKPKYNPIPVPAKMIQQHDKVITTIHSLVIRSCFFSRAIVLSLSLSSLFPILPSSILL